MTAPLRTIFVGFLIGLASSAVGCDGEEDAGVACFYEIRGTDGCGSSTFKEWESRCVEIDNGRPCTEVATSGTTCEAGCCVRFEVRDRVEVPGTCPAADAAGSDPSMSDAAATPSDAAGQGDTGPGGASTTGDPATCVPTGDACSGAGDCCGFAPGDSTCVDFAGEGAACADLCVQDSDCISECCVPLEGGGGACGSGDHCA